MRIIPCIIYIGLVICVQPVLVTDGLMLCFYLPNELDLVKNRCYLKNNITTR